MNSKIHDNILVLVDLVVGLFENDWIGNDGTQIELICIALTHQFRFKMVVVWGYSFTYFVLHTSSLNRIESDYPGIELKNDRITKAIYALNVIWFILLTNNRFLCKLIEFYKFSFLLFFQRIKRWSIEFSHCYMKYRSLVPMLYVESLLKSKHRSC